MNIVPLPDSNVNCNVVFQDSRNTIWLGAATSLYCLNENWKCGSKQHCRIRAHFVCGNLVLENTHGHIKGLVTLLQEKESND